jgi:hypothetical protein
MPPAIVAAPSRVCTRQPLRTLHCAVILALGCQPLAADPAPHPFAQLLGRWTGEGRLGIAGSKAEAVKCRVTYIEGATVDDLEQTLRCASAGAKIEVKSQIRHTAGAISGTWTETVYVLSGNITGEVTPKGFRVTVRGTDLTANMDILFAGARQVVEIQFLHSSLIGLTLVLQKG